MAETLESEDAEKRVYLTTSGTPGQKGYWESRRIEWKLPTPASNTITLRQAALDALTTNRNFIASTPTAGQTASHVKQMARQQNAIIRIVLGLLEGTD